LDELVFLLPYDKPQADVSREGIAEEQEALEGNTDEQGIDVVHADLAEGKEAREDEKSEEFRPLWYRPNGPYQQHRVSLYPHFYMTETEYKAKKAFEAKTTHEPGETWRKHPVDTTRVSKPTVPLPRSKALADKCAQFPSILTLWLATVQRVGHHLSM